MRKRPRRWPVTAVVAGLVLVVTATACGGEGAGSPYVFGGLRPVLGR